MKKSNMSSSKAAGGKVFYLALILSVAAVGSVAYFTIGRLSESLGAVSDSSSQQNVEWSVPDGFDEVNKPQSNVQKDVPVIPESKPEESTTTLESSGTASEETFFFSSGKERIAISKNSGSHTSTS